MGAIPRLLGSCSIPKDFVATMLSVNRNSPAVAGLIILSLAGCGGTAPDDCVPDCAGRACGLEPPAGTEVLA